MQQHHSSLIGKSYNPTINCNDTDRFILLNLNEAKNDFVKVAVIEKTNLSWCFSANHFPGECTSNKCLSNKLMNAWVIILLFNFFFIYLSHVSTYFNWFYDKQLNHSILHS